MPRCAATTRKGSRCKNSALDGEQLCEIHYRLRSESEPAPERESTQAPRGEAASSPGARADRAALEGLQEDDPAAAGGATPRDRVQVDPELFSALEADEKAAKAAAAAAPPSPPPPPRGALLEANPGPWHPRVLEGVILPPLNRRFTADDVPELEGAEADTFLEALSASLNRIAARVDPNNPYSALALSSCIMLGTRYAPKILRRRKRNGKPESSPSSSNGRAEPTRSSRSPDPEPAAAPAPEEAGTWADQFGGQL